MSTALPPYAPSLQPDCNQTATRLQPDCNQTATSPQPHASQVVATLLEVGGVYLLTTHDSLTTHYSLQVVGTLLGWVVLSVASVVPSRHAPWASSGTLLWIDKCCINQETPETIKAARTSVCSATYIYLLSSDLLLTTCYLLTTHLLMTYCSPLLKAGVDGFGRFLDCSDGMIAFVSMNYFSRIWCVYELLEP